MSETPSILSVSPALTGGGAERVALTLHERYMALGLDSWLAVADVNAAVENVVRIPVQAQRSPWARTLLAASHGLEGRAGRRGSVRWTGARALRLLAEPSRVTRVLRGHEDFEFPWTSRLLDLPPSPPDVLHLHNLHGAFFDVRMLPELTARVPTVMTLHDAWMLTGHCAQPFDCEGWRQGCGECPDLSRYVPVFGEKTAENLDAKRKAILDSRMGIAAPSKWLLDMVESAGLLGEGRDGRVIPNGVDTDVFSPGSRDEARAALGLPPDKKIIVLAARGVRDNPFKGFDVFAAAVERLPDETSRNLLIVAIGDSGEAQRLGCAELLPVPFVTSGLRVAQYYRAADLLVNSSRAEVFGLAVAEAMACGTLVIATRTGGVVEVVEDRCTGLLVDVNDSAGLAAAIDTALSESDGWRAMLGARAARRIDERFSLRGQVEAYLGWYSELVSQGCSTVD